MTAKARRSASSARLQIIQQDEVGVQFLGQAQRLTFACP